MKKYLLTVSSALIIGFFLLKFFLKQYDEYKGIKVSNSVDNLYFIQYGVFSSLESLEENTISLQNYVYNKQDDLYYVYVGITKIEDNSKKIVEFYNKLGYEVIIKKFNITNKKFVDLLNNYDEILKNTDDETALAAIINQTLIKYEEVVINGG